MVTASIVIAAHNEEAVISKCLDTLMADALPGEFDITVVANGCTDRTVQLASGHRGVRVVELATSGKAKALNAGDGVAIGFPRIYLDADIFVEANVVRALRDALTGHDRADRSTGSPDLLAVVPRRQLDLDRRPFLVRCYFAINDRLPVVRNGLFGRGMIGVSAEGRSRFSQFPEMVADDLFLDSLFESDEKREISEVASVVAVPHRTRDLFRRLVRVRRGNAELRAAGRSGQLTTPIRSSDPLSWLTDVVLRTPSLMPAAGVYVAITVAAAAMARVPPKSEQVWARDESTRTTRFENRLARTTRPRQLTICFHGIGLPGRQLEPGESRYWISEAKFYEILDEVAQWPNLRVTFDDGNASDIQIGLPALMKRDLTATFFVLSGRTGQPGSLSAADLLQLSSSGMTVGTHGMRHRSWRSMPSPEWTHELVTARADIAGLIGRPVEQAALPLGQYDRRLLADLRHEGYSAVHTSDRRVGRAGAWLQPRFSVKTEDTPQSLRDAVQPGPLPRRAMAFTKSVVKRMR